MGVPAPRCCQAEAVPAVVNAARNLLGDRMATRCLVVAPDAVADHLREPCASAFAAFAEGAVEVPVRAVMPPKTPVCYASIFTGAPPEVHGIRKYEKPVLQCDTLFDVLAREGKRVAIVAVEGASMDRIFRDRPIDYFSEKYDPHVTGRTIQLLNAGAHDVIVAYLQGYDDTMHKLGPVCAASLAAVALRVEYFRTMRDALDRAWAGCDRVLATLPDHGAHATDNGGDHGEDIPQDMLVHHFYRISRRSG